MLNKQTAVDWLINELTKKRKYYINNAILPIFKNSLQEREINKLLEQAKAMEKEQNSEAYKKGWDEGTDMMFKEVSKIYDANKIFYNRDK